MIGTVRSAGLNREIATLFTPVKPLKCAIVQTPNFHAVIQVITTNMLAFLLEMSYFRNALIPLKCQNSVDFTLVLVL